MLLLLAFLIPLHPRRFADQQPLRKYPNLHVHVFQLQNINKSVNLYIIYIIYERLSDSLQYSEIRLIYSIKTLKPNVQNN